MARSTRNVGATYHAIMPHNLTPILTKIYKQATLEDTLALSLTCRTFKSILDSQDTTLVAAMVQQRVPWMRPGESGTGLGTWRDCARVVCARKRALLAGKWTEIENLGSVVGVARPKRTYLSPIDVSGKLPKSYVGMFDDVVETQVEDAVIFGRNLGSRDPQKPLALNLTTLTTVKMPQKPRKRVCALLQSRGTQTDILRKGRTLLRVPRGSKWFVTEESTTHMSLEYYDRDLAKVKDLVVRKADADSSGVIDCLESGFEPKSEYTKMFDGGALAFTKSRLFYGGWVCCYIDVPNKTMVVLSESPCVEDLKLDCGKKTKSEVKKPNSEKRSTAIGMKGGIENLGKKSSIPSTQVIPYNGLLYQMYGECLIPLMVDFSDLQKINSRFVYDSGNRYFMSVPISRTFRVSKAPNVAFRPDWPVLGSLGRQHGPGDGLVQGRSRWVCSKYSPRVVLDLLTKQTFVVRDSRSKNGGVKQKMTSSYRFVSSYAGPCPVEQLSCVAEGPGSWKRRQQNLCLPDIQNDGSVVFWRWSRVDTKRVLTRLADVASSCPGCVGFELERGVLRDLSRYEARQQRKEFEDRQEELDSDLEDDPELIWMSNGKKQS